MADVIVKDPVEVVDPAAPAPAEQQLPTRDELKEKGWSAAEIEEAEKRGMAAKPETVKTPDELAAEKKASEDKANADAAKRKADEEAARKPKGDLPDFTMTPEQEKVFLETFGPGTPPRAMYFRMMNERKSRQTWEKRAQEAEKARKDLEARLNAAPKPKADGEEDEDPEDRPLTVKQLKELQKAEAEAIAKQQQEQQERAEQVADAQRVQEDYARNIYPDFDDTVKLAAQVMKDLDSLVPEKHRQAKVVKLIRDLQVAAANADRIDLDEYHAAHIAYEIGQFHPEFGKKPNADKNGDDKNPKAPGGLTPGQMKRVEENARRRGSSAALPAGGGERTVSADQVTAAQLNAMDYKRRQVFAEKYPEHYKRLLQG